jgi:raffinose/stachyose/melibiose transport system permease protein
MSLYGNKKMILLYLLPTLLILGIFVYYPMVLNIFFSFFKWSAFSEKKIFVGIENYVRVLQDQVTWTALKNNILYAVISVVCQCGIGLILAAALEEVVLRKFQKFFRSVLFIPSVISISVIGLLWQLIYNPNIGIVNAFLALIEKPEWQHVWLGESSTAIFAIIFVSQWQYTGYIMLLYLVGLHKIPSELYESAMIDGANPIHKFLYITVPQMKETILVVTVITVIGAFKVFSEVYIMTSGGPGRASEVLATTMYRSAFRNDEMGIATAMAGIIFVITFVFTFFQIKLAKTGQD